MIESQSLQKKKRRSSTHTCMRPVERSFTQKHLAVRPRVMAFSSESSWVPIVLPESRTCWENIWKESRKHDETPLKIPTTVCLRDSPTAERIQHHVLRADVQATRQDLGTVSWAQCVRALSMEMLRPGVAICPEWNSQRRNEELKPWKFPYKMTVATDLQMVVLEIEKGFWIVTAVRVFENSFSKTLVWALVKHRRFPPHRTMAWHLKRV